MLPLCEQENPSTSSKDLRLFALYKQPQTATSQVSIVAMSGAVGEALVYGTATGGATDLDNLGQLMNQTNPPMEGKDQQSQAR